MSDEETTAEEWKTIRVSASSYYRIAELSGLFTATLGTKVPMSLVVDWAIIAYHDELYPRLRKVVTTPDAIKEVRKMWKDYRGKFKELFEEITHEK